MRDFTSHRRQFKPGCNQEVHPPISTTIRPQKSADLLLSNFNFFCVRSSSVFICKLLGDVWFVIRKNSEAILVQDGHRSFLKLQSDCLAPLTLTSKASPAFQLEFCGYFSRTPPTQGISLGLAKAFVGSVIDLEFVQSNGLKLKAIAGVFCMTNFSNKCERKKSIMTT
jgi:hypothetical protein